MSTKMKKKIAVITGASSGMGREIAVQVAEKFAFIEEIVLIARRQERLEALGKELKKIRTSLTCTLLIGDISDEEFLQKYQQVLTQGECQVKLLINAAGYGKIGTVSEIAHQDQGGIVRVNCEALTVITRLTLPYMAENSRIINFASMAAFLPQAGFAVYAASKAYVYSYTMALAEELRPQTIYCTAVCPGPVATEFFDVAEQGKKRSWYKNLFMADSRKVVRKALQDSIQKKRISIYGSSMKVLYGLTKMVPDRVLVHMTGMLNKTGDKGKRSQNGGFL